MEREFGFIIDTNSYSGNFERELCAYMTGHVGECEVGEEYAVMYVEKYQKALDDVIDKPDEYGCYRPTEIYPTINRWNNGVGGHFNDGQEELALEHFKNSQMISKTQQINLYESYKKPLVKGWTIERLEETINNLKKEVEKIENMTIQDIRKYPAYESVIIYFDNVLIEETITLLKERAYEFFKLYEKDVEVVGFRVVDLNN